MTNQQKSRFRRAYRDTFAAENHGDAIKAMYAQFTQLYGVSVDALQALVAAEWKKDPRQYHQLQSRLAARRAAAQGLEKRLRTAPTKARPASKPKKPREHQPEKPNPKKSKEQRPPSRKLPCPVCRKSVSVADNGCLRGHHGSDIWCRGSGRKVAVPAKSSVSGPERRISSSVRTVSGGSPGLGRRR